MKAQSNATIDGNELVESINSAQLLEVVVDTIQADEIRPFYRYEIPIRLVLDGKTQKLSFNAEGSDLQVDFLTHEYTAPSSALSSKDGGVAVLLDAPRQVATVQLKTNITIPSGTSIEFFRKDGDTVSEKPTVSGLISNRRVNVPIDFTDGNFSMKMSSGGPSFSKSNVQSVTLRGYPTSPRMGVALNDNVDEANFFWRAAGEIGKETPLSEGQAQVGPDLATAMQQLVDNSLEGDALPEELEFTLIIESDAQCRVQLIGGIEYQLVAKSFTSDDEKIVLRFDGTRLNTEVVELEVPRDVDIRGALVEIDKSLSVSTDQSESTTDTQNGISVLQTGQGVSLNTLTETALQIPVDKADTVLGVELGMMALASGSEVQVSLKEDWEGKPLGREVASSTRVLQDIGKKLWVVFTLDTSVTVQAGTYWLTVRPVSGAALWLIDDATAPVEVRSQTAKTGSWQEVVTSDASSIFYRIRFTQPGSSTKNETGGASDILSIRLGQVTIDALGAAGDSSPDNSRTTFEFATALTEYLDAQPGSVDLVQIPLEFITSQKGLVTVYPPVITYDIRTDL